MSYILDALRRSQAERERGRVPGLDAQPVAGSPSPMARRGGSTWGLGLAAGLALGLVAALAAWIQSRDTVAASTPALASAPPVPAGTAPGRSNPISTPAPFPIVVSAPARPPTPASRVAAPVVLAVAPPTSSAAQAGPMPLAQLPPAQRRELPALAVGGVIWSESAASRFVILDGQVVREGATLAPDLRLLRIERTAAILNWRGRLLSLPL